MLRLIKSLFTRKKCTDCEHRSPEKMLGPKGFGGWMHYCLCPAKQEKKYSFAEGREIITSYPCNIQNENGWCRWHKEKMI